MTWTSMPYAPASLITRTTLDPPPVSCCHRLRRLAPITIWVIVIVGGLIYFPMLILGPIGERIIG